MEIFFIIGGAVASYGTVWFGSVHWLAKYFVNPKNTSMREVTSYSYRSSTYWTLEFKPQQGAIPKEAAEEKVKDSFERALWAAAVWPLAIPYNVLRVHFGRAQAKAQNTFVDQVLEARRSELLVKIVRANLDSTPLMLQAAEAEDEEQLISAESKLKSTLEKIQPKQELESQSQFGRLLNVIRRNPKSQLEAYQPWL